MKTKTIKKNLVLLSIIGVINSFYLLLPHISNMILPCSACQIVAESKYSAVFFVPNALLGIIFYFWLIIVFLYWDELKNKFGEKILKFLTFLSLNLSMLFYIFLFYAQWILIGYFCVFCLFSTFLTIVIEIIYLKKKKNF